jgi:PhnB protein
MTDAGLPTNNEDAIREALAALRDALRARDAQAFADGCTSDLLVFDLDPPLSRSGAAEGARRLGRWLANWRGPVEDDLHDLRIVEGGDVAFATALSHLRATDLEGQRMALWSRVTFGLRREGGRWRVAHRHASVPFHMDGSLRAAIDLRP